MKKIYLSALSLAVVFGSNAQMKTQQVSNLSETTTVQPTVYNAKALSLWSNTFGTPADWTVGHDATACSLDWQIGNFSTTGAYQTADIESTTAADGWAMIDSDAYGGPTGGSDVEDSWITTTNPIADLGGIANAVVQFETNYRNFNNEMTYIVIGIGDGAGGVTWPDLDPTTDISAMNNVFQAMPTITSGVDSDNPQLMQVNISSALAGLTAIEAADLYLRFHWTGTWGYAWFVDDVNIIEQPADDVINQSVFVAGTNNEGLEYGRTPESQLDVTYDIGMQVYNFGINNQSLVEYNADFGSFSSFASDAIDADSIKVLQTTETLTLPIGVYTGNYTVSAGADVLGNENYNNNTGLREFEVTSSIYSLDGIGVYTNSSVGTFGTGQVYADATIPTYINDGMILGTHYHIHDNLVILSLEVMLDVDNTVAGSELYGSIMDSATINNDLTTQLHVAAPHTVTAADITAGFATLYFPGGLTLNPGGYYAAVELVSYSGSFPVRVLDDLTVAQPFWASMYFNPETSTWVSNPEALAIRLNSSALGLGENTVDGVSVYPNPSKGVITISNDNNTENAIAIFNVLGKEVYNTTSSSITTVDLSTEGAGVYLVKVSNGNGTMVERVVIK